MKGRWAPRSVALLYLYLYSHTVGWWYKGSDVGLAFERSHCRYNNSRLAALYVERPRWAGTAPELAVTLTQYTTFKNLLHSWQLKKKWCKPHHAGCCHLQNFNGNCPVVRHFWKFHNDSFFNHFCRAMLCISASYAVVRCLSVCWSSVCHVHALCQIIIFTIFSPSSSHTILVFLYQTWQYSDGDFLTVEKNRDFRPIHWF